MPHPEVSIHVDAPVQRVYNHWTHFEDFPKFMCGITEVRPIDDRRAHWVMQIEGGESRRSEWDTEIIELRPEELVSWRVVAGECQGCSALVSLAPDGAGTRVTMQLRRMRTSLPGRSRVE